MPSPLSGPTVTSIVAPLDDDTADTAPLNPPVNTGVKSAASTPPTLSLSLTRNVTFAALVDAAVGFSRFTDNTVGATVSMVTRNAGDEGLTPPPPLPFVALAWNAYVPSASVVPRVVEAPLPRSSRDRRADRERSAGPGAHERHDVSRRREAVQHDRVVRGDAVGSGRARVIGDRDDRGCRDARIHRDFSRRGARVAGDVRGRRGERVRAWRQRRSRVRQRPRTTSVGLRRADRATSDLRHG